MKVALLMGTQYLDPAAYGGWDGGAACAAADRDIDMRKRWAQDRGFDRIEVLINEQFTPANALTAGKDLLAMLPTLDDLLYVAFSTHGGQEPDRYPFDEIDHLDETICTFSGPLLDDRVAELWPLVRCRVHWDSDTCNAGTPYRGRPPRAPWHTVGPYRLRSPARAGDRLTGQVIAYGGASDGKSSMGGPRGGAWTLAEDAVWQAYYSRGRPGKRGWGLFKWLVNWGSGGGIATPDEIAIPDRLTYRTWFLTAKAKMNLREQEPIYSEFGAVSDEFRDRLALT